MPRIKKLYKKKRKFRLLLDSAFAQPSVFSKLSKKANLAHMVHTYQMSLQADDKEIYILAVKEKRFVVTVNYKDFKKLVKPNEAGIIALPSHLSNKVMEKLLLNFISGKDPDDHKGKAIKLDLQNLKL